MEKKPHSDDFGISLVQTNQAQKAMVAKMRTKLAGGSAMDVQITTKRRVAIQKNAFGWFSKLGLAAILILVNLAYLASKGEAGGKKVVKHAQALPSPKSGMSVEDQALYWTYALYDYKRLKTQFGVIDGVVVDGRTASVRLAELLPKVNAKTRLIIYGYLPPARRNS